MSSVIGVAVISVLFSFENLFIYATTKAGSKNIGDRIQETEYRIKNNEIVLGRCIIIRILSSLDSLTNPVAPMNRDFRFTAVIHGECSRCRVSGYTVFCILSPVF